MSEYIVSARKYRPLTFDTVVGQKSLVATLKNAVKDKRLAHAYLFCGPRGVGKTTCARIFAKAINCLNPTHQGDACEECESCKSFKEQRSYNIFELDAASNNSVEHIKTLMEQTHVPPQVGKYKVFIIDEVHMLSTAAFNAFLKTLEEPPTHVIFILATTEKHKILPTILSRCQIYDFERMTINDTIEHLRNIAKKEGVTCEDEALAVIAEKADGGMRDALSIFDQAVSFCQGNITYEKIIEDLNILDAENYFRFIDMAFGNDVKGMMLLLNSIIGQGFDIKLLIEGLSKHIRNLLMAKDESTLFLLETSKQRLDRYKTQTKKCPTIFLYKALRILNNCDINYRQSGNKRLLVELTLIEISLITASDSENAPIESEQKKQESPFKQTPKNETQGEIVTKDSTPEQPTAKQATAITSSWNNLQMSYKQKKNDNNDLIDVPIDSEKTIENETNHFTQEQLEQEWVAMCNRIPQQYNATATRMKNIHPTITEFPKIEIVVENKLIMEKIEKIKSTILNNLQLKLHNKNISLSLSLSEKQDKIKTLTRREMFEEMEKNNAAVGKLRRLLDLELTN